MRKNTVIKISFSIIFTVFLLFIKKDIVYAYVPELVHDMPAVNNTIFASVIDGDNLYIGGEFTEVGGLARNGIAKISISTGEVDPDFNPILLDWDGVEIGHVYALEVFEGYVYVGGGFGLIDRGLGVDSVGEFVRLDKTTGLLDASCDPNVSTAASPMTVKAIYVDSNGDIYLGGSFNFVGPTSRYGLAKLTSNCSLVSDWSANVFEVEENPSGEGVFVIESHNDHIYVGGFFDSVGGVQRYNLAKVSKNDGSVDTSFAPNISGNPSVVVYSLAVSGDDIYVGGGFDSIGGEGIEEFAKLDPVSGEVDLSCNAEIFSPDAFTVFAIGIDDEGNIYLGGDFRSVGGQNMRSIARLDPLCNVDQTFADGIDPSYEWDYGGDIRTISINEGNIFAGGEIGYNDYEYQEFLYHWIIDIPEEEVGDDESESKKKTCEYSKPDKTTWIKLEPMVKNGISGMYLTWTQYGANKINIKIDDGSGNFPWQISNTSNDGHEFLPNVSTSQSVKIQPVNNCKKGDFGDPVSYTLNSRGWYNNGLGSSAGVTSNIINANNGDLILNKIGCITFDPKYKVYYLKSNVVRLIGTSPKNSIVELFINNEKILQTTSNYSGNYLLGHNLPNGKYDVSIRQGSNAISFVLNVDTEFTDFDSLLYPCLVCE